MKNFCKRKIPSVYTLGIIIEFTLNLDYYFQKCIISKNNVLVQHQPYWQSHLICIPQDDINFYLQIACVHATCVSKSKWS